MKYLYLFLTVLFLFSCKDVEQGPIDHDGIAPGQVTDIHIKPLPGGAEISYQLPDDTDLLYVEAVYRLPNGEENKVNASYNFRSIKVEGFPKIQEYEATLTCVDRSGNRSQPQLVKFTPETPPMLTAFESLEVVPDFGGLNIKWKNPSGANLAVMIYRKDSVGDDVNIDAIYSTSTSGNYSVRGLDTIYSEFSVKIRDKWNNFSEPLRKEFSPIYEVKINKNDFRALTKDFDGPEDHLKDDHGNIPKLWDNTFQNNVFGASIAPWYTSFSITLDTKKFVRMSRFVIWQYGWPGSLDYGHYYYGGNGRHYQLWGTTKENPSADMADWFLIVDCPIIKPSGRPNGYGRDYMSDEDYDLAKNRGHEFLVPLSTPPIRLLRLMSLEGFEGTLACPSEIDVYGDPR